MKTDPIHSISLATYPKSGPNARLMATSWDAAGPGFGLRSGYQIAVRNPSYWLRPVTWPYAIIRAFTSSYWNHWAGLWIREDGIAFVVEMRGGGKRKARRITRYEIWLARNPDRIFEILPCSRPTTKTDLDKYIGGYDYLSLAFRHPVNRVTRIWIGGKRDKQYTCSEYWARVKGLPDAYRLAPSDLARIYAASRP